MDIRPEMVGTKDADGKIIQEASVCPITGQDVLEQHHVFINLGDGVHFIRVLSQHARQVTEDMKADLLASVGSKSKPPKQKNAAPDAAEGQA